MAYESLPLFPSEVPVPPAKQLKRMKPTVAAYLAGLLDGEGHFGLQHTKAGWSQRYPEYRHWNTFVTIVMTQKPLLEEIASLVPWGNAGVMRGNFKLRGRAKPSWKIKWSGRVAASLCRAILPYLRLKKRHAEIIIWLDDEKASAIKVHTGRRAGSQYPSYIKDMHARAHAEFRVLNQRGQDNEPIRYGNGVCAEYG